MSNEMIAAIILNSINSPTWSIELVKIFNEKLVNIYVDSMNNTVIELGGKVEENTFMAKAKEYMENRTGELVGTGKIGKLEESTRNMIKSDLVKGMDNGSTPIQIASDIKDNYAFSSSRAENIARTETGFAWNDAAIASYETQGYKSVLVYDGDGDTACQDANGQTWSIAYAKEHLLEHPRCVRSFGPSTSDDVDLE